MEINGMSRRSKNRVKINDSFQNPATRSGFFMPNVMEATQYPVTRLSMDFQLLSSLYRNHWIIARIIDTIPKDMMKNGYEIQTQASPEAIDKIIKLERQVKLQKKIRTGLTWGRLFGGAAGLILLKGHENYLDEPLRIEDVLPDSFKGLLIFERWTGVDPGIELIDDICSPDFGLPKIYNITVNNGGQLLKVHHSRILRFEFNELPYIEKVANQYWGLSEIERVFDELKKRDNVSWNIAMLTFMANLRTLKVDGIGQLLAATSEQAQQRLWEYVNAQNALTNNNGLQIIDKNDEYQNHQYTFGGLADVYNGFMLDIAGAAEIPVTKLYGRSPSGLNATGDGDLENYYNKIEQEQEDVLRPIYDRLLPIMFMSEIGAVPDDLDYNFNPVKNLTDAEKADIASKNIATATSLFNVGVISQKTLLLEAQKQSYKTGLLTCINGEDIEKANDKVENMSEGFGGFGDSFGDVQLNDSVDANGKEHAPKGSSDGGRFVESGGSSSESSQEPQDISELLGKEHAGVKGEAAIDKLLKEKNGHVKGAFYRKETGHIDLIWGDDDKGLQHIIKRRESEGFDGESFVAELPKVIRNGEFDRQKTGRFVFSHGNLRAVVSPDLHKNRLTFLLTAFENY